MQGLKIPLYHLPELLQAPVGSTICITEGEKHADQILAWGILATTNAGGAKKFRPHHATVLARFDCVILPDNDQAGREHTEVVASALRAAGCANIRILNLPNQPPKGDVIDWVSAGGTASVFAKLVAQAPDWTPSRKAQATKPEPPAGDIPTMQAYHALRDALDKNGNGAVLPTHANMVLILKRDPFLNGLVQFNSFTGLHMLRKPVPVLDKAIRCSPGPYPRQWDGDDITRLLAYVQKSWAHNFKKATVEECLLLEGRDNEIHTVRDYLAVLKWDGKKRLDSWLTMTFGCPQDLYHAAVASKVLIAAVRRVRQPGCKYDQLVVLEGDQGIGKSPAIKILFGDDWYTDQLSDLSSKDAAIDLRGKWVVEMGEIEQLSKAEVETIKAFLSRSTDHYRPPYGRVAIDVPRQSVLIGTTNANEYLRDATGNRRVWPVKCLSKLPEGADLDWLRDNRDQLWAEAAQREANAETIWLDNAAIREVAIVEQADRMSEDPWKWKIARYCEVKLACYETAQKAGLVNGAIELHMAAYPAELRGDFVTVAELLEYSLAVPTVQQTKGAEMRGGG
jgi:predicted P-loop ATPase